MKSPMFMKEMTTAAKMQKKYGSPADMKEPMKMKKGPMTMKKGEAMKMKKDPAMKMGHSPKKMKKDAAMKKNKEGAMKFNKKLKDASAAGKLDDSPEFKAAVDKS